MEDLKINWPAFISFFNATLRLHGSVIPELKYITKGKKAQVQRIVKELGTKQALIDAVVNMARSDVCNGRVRTKTYPNGWVASFPWLTSKDENVADMANGKLDNPPAAELTADEQRQLEQERYRQQQEERRAEARRIEEEERERRARQREEWARGCVSYGEYQRLKAEGRVPTLNFKPET